MVAIMAWAIKTNSGGNNLKNPVGLKVSRRPSCALNYHKEVNFRVKVEQGEERLEWGLLSCYEPYRIVVPISPGNIDTHTPESSSGCLAMPVAVSGSACVILQVTADPAQGFGICFPGSMLGNLSAFDFRHTGDKHQPPKAMNS
jgi:hypothetical protein